MNNKLGLYIHIPFCVKKCNYCDFYSMSATENDYNDYVAILKNNLNYHCDKYKDRVVDSIYFGGGTPSVLGTDRIVRILRSIIHSFNLSDNCEITIEVNPGANDNLDFAILRKSGVNRVSVGFQSADDKELEILGRLHKRRDVSDTIERIKSGGIDNFSLDVMLGIPLQTIESLNETLDFCIESGASHISTYMLKIEKNTPFYLNFGDYIFADEDLQCDMYEFTCDKLKRCGFRHYEISNFCKDDRLSRHNMKYWMLEDYLGLGPSAHSMVDKKRFYYPRSIEAFRNNEIIFDSDVNTAEEYVMLSLRTDIGFDLNEYKKLSNSPISHGFMREIERFEKLGFITVNNSFVTLTEKGYLLSNSIISSLLSKGSV